MITTTNTSLVPSSAVPAIIRTGNANNNNNNSTATASSAAVIHRHTKETFTYCREKDEDLVTANTTTVHNTNNASTMTTTAPDTPPLSKEESTASSVTSGNISHQTEPSEQEPYKELKWGTSAPLFLNDTTFDTNALSSMTKTKQTLPLHAGRTALLVVDVQPEYWSQCPAVRKDFPDFPKNLAKLVAQCRAQRSKIIWVRADYRYAHSPWLVQFARLHSKDVDNIHHIPAEVHSNPQDIEWEDFATPLGGEYVIPKTSWSSTRHTALMDLLKQSGIDTVLVAGLITSVCVQHSAFGIFEAGYRTLLVTDACADRGKARHDAALALYGDYMYELLTVQHLCQPNHPYYLRPAQPVWLTVDSVNNLVQPQFFNSLQDSIVNHPQSSSPGKGDERRRDYDDTVTTTTSNIHGHPTFYKVEEQQQPTKTHDGATKASHKIMTMDSTATARTSTSSLSTLTTNPSPLLEPTPAEAAPPAAIEV